MLRTIVLLLLSNVFMTFAWYGHLKKKGLPLWKAILIAWGIAFFELPDGACQQGRLCQWFQRFPVKITQEIITLVVFTIFAVLYLKEPLRANYLVSFLFLLGAVYFAFKK
jgi:uncharacterized protein (DUF486 family)